MYYLDEYKVNGIRGDFVFVFNLRYKAYRYFEFRFYDSDNDTYLTIHENEVLSFIRSNMWNIVGLNIECRESKLFVISGFARDLFSRLNISEFLMYVLLDALYATDERDWVLRDNSLCFTDSRGTWVKIPLKESYSLSEFKRILLKWQIFDGVKFNMKALRGM